MPFQPFDPDADIQPKRRRLPHWFQQGRTYFVTFRLADSLPRSKRDQLEEERATWLATRGLTILDEIRTLPQTEQDNYRNQFSENSRPFSTRVTAVAF